MKEPYNMKVGYDLDGVICREPDYLSRIFSVSIKLGIFLRHRQPVLYYPEYVGCIITGRPEDDRDITLKWLNKNNISFYVLEIPLIFKHTAQSTNFKSVRIKENNLDVYIESDPFVANLLCFLCPNCLILHINNDKAKEYLHE